VNVLLVHAHHEPRSFCSALADRAQAALSAAGHQVVRSDLYAMGWDPVSDRRNFTSVKDAAFLKQQQEELFASERGGFAPDVEAELRKLEACDALLLSFPLWWFGLPAVLKGWIDRVFAMGRVYGGPKLYENGVGRSRVRALAIPTTGGPEVAYSGWGFNPPLEAILAPIQHGTFWFNGMLPLEPFVAWSPVRVSAEQREQYLHALDARVARLFEEAPIRLPKLGEFPNLGLDAKQRFLAVVRRARPVDDAYRARVPEELAHLAALKRDGVVLRIDAAPPADPQWRVFLTLRAGSRAEAEEALRGLPLAAWLAWELTELAPFALPPAR
jgi:NAD(P)H dehydrogenase (quinone)